MSSLSLETLDLDTVEGLRAAVAVLAKAVLVAQGSLDTEVTYYARISHGVYRFGCCGGSDSKHRSACPIGQVVLLAQRFPLASEDVERLNVLRHAVGLSEIAPWPPRSRKS